MKDNQNPNSQDVMATEAANALKALKSVQVEPSAYLTQRILNNYELRTEVSQKKSTFSLPSLFVQFKFWPSFSVALATLFISFFAFKSFNNSQQPAIYALNQDYVIRMDIRPLPQDEIAYAEISLPDENVQFSSKKFTDLKLQKKLVVSWDSMVAKQYLPIVVQGIKPGSSKVIVNFYDSEHKLVTTREISLYFKGGA
jgi:hypothetical protein